MKNLQVIDRAINAAYDIWPLSDAEFRELQTYPEQDIFFADEMSDKAVAILAAMYERAGIAKPNVQGIHGTIFYNMPEKKEFYPNRRERDIADGRGRPVSTRDLY